MYQMEKKKLNQKYKEKDESIRSLSTQLQINKLALLEINSYLMALTKLSKSPEEDPDKSEEASESKRHHVLTQMTKLLGQLTSNSSNALNTITNSILEQKRASSLASNSAAINKMNGQQQPLNGAPAFRSELFLCSSCYGDLFIV